MVAGYSEERGELNVSLILCGTHSGCARQNSPITSCTHSVSDRPGEVRQSCSASWRSRRCSWSVVVSCVRVVMVFPKSPAIAVGYAPLNRRSRVVAVGRRMVCLLDYQLIRETPLRFKRNCT